MKKNTYDRQNDRHCDITKGRYAIFWEVFGLNPQSQNQDLIVAQHQRNVPQVRIHETKVKMVFADKFTMSFN